MKPPALVLVEHMPVTMAARYRYVIGCGGCPWCTAPGTDWRHCPLPWSHGGELEAAILRDLYRRRKSR